MAILKKKKKVSKKSLTHKLDIVFSKVVRSVGRCERCSSSHELQCAHIYSRRYVHTRWHSLNALALCASCHFWAHQNPRDFAKFVNELLGEGTMDEIRDKAHDLTPTTVEWMQEMYEKLKMQLN